MKQRIRLTESGLHRIVKESVNNVLNEIEVKPKRDDRYGSREWLEKEYGEYDGQVPKDWITTSTLRNIAYGYKLKFPKKNKYSYDENGYDQYGLDRKGYDREGYNKEGFNKMGFDREGYGRAGFNKEGFNRKGYNREGFDKEGFDRKGYNKEGYNKEGFNKKGYDREGYNKKGFNVNGLNRDNIDKQGHRKGNKTWEDVVKEYISKEGDMLWRIEEAEYSDSSKWEKAQQKKDIRELVHIVFNNIINNVVSVEYRKNSRFRTFIKNKIYEVLYDRLDSIY